MLILCALTGTALADSPEVDLSDRHPRAVATIIGALRVEVPSLALPGAPRPGVACTHWWRLLAIGVVLVGLLALGARLDSGSATRIDLGGSRLTHLLFRC